MSLELSRSPSAGCPYIIIPGQVFKKWTVIGNIRYGLGGQYHRQIQCKCVCGAVKYLYISQLINENKCYTCRSCAVKNRQPRNPNAVGRNPLYKLWSAVKQRCYNPRNKSYPDYGGRGIRMCDRWRFSFENFMHDMPGRSAGYHLDRIDVDGLYSPENCRWISPGDNQRNRRNSKKNKHKYLYVLKEKLCNSCIKKAGSNVDACIGESQ